MIPHGGGGTLAGRTIVMSGGSRGIGLAIARRLAQEGARVVVAARDPERLARASELLSAELDREIAGVAVDTAHDASVRAMTGEVVARLGGLDILVNCAARPGGQAAPPKLAEMTDEAFWSDVNVKVMGYVRCAREAAPHMIEGGWGRIVNISGLAARQSGSIVGSIRNVSVAALTKNLADELGPKGINVTVVHPGLTRTEAVDAMIAARAQAAGIGIAEMEQRMAANVAIGRIVDADEVADVVAFLASPRSAAINGDAIACGGGTKGAIHY